MAAPVEDTIFHDGASSSPDVAPLPSSSSGSAIDEVRGDGDGDGDEPNPEAKPGAWVGIDFGTTNTACAAWDATKGRAKLLRLGRADLSTPPPGGGGGKEGRIVPSAVLFRWAGSGGGGVDDGGGGGGGGGGGWERVVGAGHALIARVGHAAVRSMENSLRREDDRSRSEGRGGARGAAAAAYATSVKRILGTTPRQAEDLSREDGFLRCLPFRTERLPEKTRVGTDGVEEGLAVKLTPLLDSAVGEGANGDGDEEGESVAVTPVQIAATILRSVRLAAESHLSKGTLAAPGVVATRGSGPTEAEVRVRNCVLGVPAHFGRAQRASMVRAAELAGFDGHVSTLTESTAAAMAYGLFVSPNARRPSASGAVRGERGDGADGAHVSCAADRTKGRGGTGEQGTADLPDESDATEKRGRRAPRKKSILVFDMGGGTTDVTIAAMSPESESPTDDPSGDGASFRVLAAAGDRRLGGDDMDEALVRLVLSKRRASSADRRPPPPSSTEHRELLHACRRAKEELCGGGRGAAAGTDPPPADSSIVSFDGAKVVVAQREFGESIRPLVERARSVVEEALSAYADARGDDRDDDDGTPDDDRTATVDEVVLVGGASRVPAVRSMLRSRFPPPRPPDLCHSIDADAAVAQGLAVRAAMLSGLVPKHEVRSAMMLDALPHSIGVLVADKNGDSGDGNGRGGAFVPILRKDSPLPAMNFATFALANVRQPGVTIAAVEDVGDDLPFEPLGEFTFLLRRLTDDRMASLDGKRTVDVGMTVESNGKFIVSIFDSNDPEHLAKKRRYQEERRGAKEGASSLGYAPRGDTLRENDYDEEHPTKDVDFPLEQVALATACVALFVLYVVVRVAFSEPPAGDSARII